MTKMVMPSTIDSRREGTFSDRFCYRCNPMGSARTKSSFGLLAAMLYVGVIIVATARSAVAAAVSGSLLPPEVISVFDLDPEVPTASAVTESAFHHMVTDTISGKVYVGATNRLYQLSADLRVEHAVMTGPHPDNPMCPPPTAECQCFGPSCATDFAKTPTDAVSMALVIDRRNGRLIACTDLYQGHCDRHQLDNITSTDPTVWSMVTPNDPRSSVVAFVAPGPPNPASTDALYVAATRSAVGLPAYRDVIPSIGVRNLIDLDLVSGDILAPSRLDVEVQQRDRFRVDFRFGFASVGFAYFLSVQRRSATADESELPVTRLSRLCQNDRSMRSYAELTLVCRGPDGRDFGGVLTAAAVVHPGSELARNLWSQQAAATSESETEHVLIAAFSNARPMMTSFVDGSQQQQAAVQASVPQSSSSSSSGLPASTLKSALCVYPMKDIRRKFTEAIQRCFYGVGHIGPDHYVQPKACYKTPFEIPDDYCGEYDINHPVVGTELVSRDAAILWPNVTVTSLAVTTATASGATVAFIATSDGRIRKVVLESGTKATEYGSIQLEPSAHIKRDTAFDQSRDHLYVMTDSRVYRLAVQNCSRYTTCEDCLGARDPYCGWCSLSRRCTRCTDSNFPCTWCVSRHRCSNNREECVGDALITGRRVRGRSDSPGPEYCPRIDSPSSGNSQLSSEVLVQSSTEASVQVKASNLQKVHTSFRCVFDVNGGVQRDGKLITAGDGSTFIECQPVLFQYSSAATPSITVPLSIEWGANDGSYRSLDNPRNVHVRVYKCSAMASSCGHCRSLDAKLNCGWCTTSRSCTVESHCLVQSGTAASQWLRRHQTCPDPTVTSIIPSSGPIDGGTRLTVTGLNLGISTTDTYVSIANIECYSVNYIEPTTRFECTTGWSERITADNVLVTIDNKFTALSIQRFSYVQPFLMDFYPTVGPLSGGTRLTLIGSHLDTGTHAVFTLKDKSNNLLSTRCEFLEQRQFNSSVCVTSSSSGPYHARFLHLSIDNGTVAHSVPGHGFLVVEDPIIKSISPDHTIISGGISMTVTGERLNVISKPAIVIYANTNSNVTTPCETVDSSVMICTPKNLRSLIGNDDDEQQRSFSSGSPLSLSYGFVMDRVTSVLNITNVTKSPVAGYRLSSSNNNHSSSFNALHGIPTPAAGTDLNSLVVGLARHMLVFPDPEFEVFDGIKQLFYIKNEYLTINGRNLNLALGVSDLRVMIGPDIECAVTSLSASQLTCLPNTSMSDPPAGKADVIIYIGDQLDVQYSIGQLEYMGSLQTGQADIFTLPVIIGIGIGAGVLLTVIIIICVAYTMKTRESTRVMRRMRNQMDVLEARVAKECKEAFAELQTDMNEVTNDILSSSGLPFRDYWNYSLRVLFPNDHNPTFLKQIEYSTYPGNGHGIYAVVGHCDETGLRLFNQLLANKVFLLLFVRTLEQQKEFVISKKVHFASLLSLALHSRMDYYTDILKTLLAELIDRAMHGRCPPKLLLRRTESVAEKLLTNWFTLLLYRFLNDSVGEPLYLLYRAIKQQTEKGPIDAATGDAKYSLSEDRLIRQQLDYQVVLLKVADTDCCHQHSSGGGGEFLVVRVLDCDTISQVKEKILDTIYRNVPYSNRPSSSDLDLEWRTGVSLPLILSDFDATSKIAPASNCNGECYSAARRVNTLRHYGISNNGAVVALVARQQTLSSSNSVPSYYNGYQRLPHVAAEIQPLAANGKGQSNSEKFYHLVRAHDADVHKGERGSKMVSEIYLTRLLSTKGTLQQYVDDLFESVFSTTSRGCVMPLAVKYMFDFLDDQALLHGIVDVEVVHLWKSNSLPLRFWVNVMKNPEFVFDIQKSSIVDSCLSVIAQTFMDSCSTSDQKLSKDSPSCKLLYAKDIPKYKNWVERYYEDIQKMPAIGDQDMNAVLQQESKSHENEAMTMAAVKELYKIAVQYNKELMHAIEEDEFAIQHSLAFRLNQVHSAMSSCMA